MPAISTDPAAIAARQAQRDQRLREELAAANDPDALVRVEVVQAMLGIARPTVYLWARQRAGFPQPVNGRWRAGDVRAFAQQLATKPTQPAREG